jgi:hypothetical protein
MNHDELITIRIISALFALTFFFFGIKILQDQFRIFTEKFAVLLLAIFVIGISFFCFWRAIL